MPSRPKRPCNQPGCAALVENARFCDTHRRALAAARGTTKERGYAGNWPKLRAMVLREEPLCRNCLEEGKTTSASEVDHIIPKARGGSEYRINLQALCKPCHSAKTLRENR